MRITLADRFRDKYTIYLFRRDGKMKEVVLKEVDSDVETRSYVKNRATKHTKNQKHPNAKSDMSSTKNTVVEKEKMDKSRFSRRRIHKKTKLEEENNLLNTEIQVSISDITKLLFFLLKISYTL